MTQTHLQNRNRLTDLESKLMATRREGGGLDQEFGIDAHTAVFKMDSQQGAKKTNKNTSSCLFYPGCNHIQTIYIKKSSLEY